MNFLLNEAELLNHTLESKEIDDTKPTNTFKVLIKYYLKDGKSREEVKKEVEKFLKNNKKYVYIKWEKTIDGMITTIINQNKVKEDNDKYKLLQINSLTIPRSELETIKSLNDEELEKFAFSILVATRTRNLIASNHSNCFDDKSILYTDALLEDEGKKRSKRFIYLLKEKGLVKTPIKISSVRCEALFISNDNDEELVIQDFNNFALYYLKWKGHNNIIKCKSEKCNTIIIKKSNVHKFCGKCADKNKRQLDSDRMKKNRILNSRK